MHLGPTTLLQVYQGKPLLLTLFTVSKHVIIESCITFDQFTKYFFMNSYSKVLDNIVQNKINREPQDTSKSEKEDFDPNITLDNLLDEATAKSMWRGNIQSVQLAAKMVR